MISRIARLDALARHRLLLLVGVLVIQPAPALGQNGACCLANADCISTDQAGCDTVSGEYLGAHTSCEGTACEGACCQSDGTCVEGGADVCAPGEFQGVGSTCAAHCPGPLGTGFRFQGQLKQGGVPLTGTVDVEASLWSAAVGGEQIGSALARTGVPVTNGLFAVELDFGTPSVFDGSSRWLELGIRSPHDPTDSRAYVTLTPRQSIQAVPYALQTRGVFVNHANNVGIGTTAPETALDVVGGEIRAKRSETQPQWVSIRSNSTSGGFIAAHSKAGNKKKLHISNLYEDDGREPAGETDIIFEVGNEAAPIEAFRITETGNVGIGTPLPAHELHVEAEAGLATAVDGVIVGSNTFGGAAGVLGLGPVRGVFGLATHSPSNVAPPGGRFGVYGECTIRDGAGVHGRASADLGTGTGVTGATSSSQGFAVFGFGDIAATGDKSFIQPHPTDPSKEIRFVSLEGNESGTYFRGSSRLVNGRAVIDVPEEFRLVTEPDGLTVQLTPRGPAMLWYDSKNLDQIVVRGERDVAFDFFVNGVRRGFADHQAIRENHAYVPERRGVPYGTQYGEAHRRILVENGILNADFTPNEQTARHMGWKLRDPSSKPRLDNE